MSKKFLSITLALILWAAASHAEAQTATYFGVLLGSTGNRAEAVQWAKQASSQLQIHLASESLKMPSSSPLYLGLVSQMIHAGTQYQVLSFLREDEGEAKTALAQAQKFFPQANIQKYVLDSNALDTGYQQTFMKRVLIVASEKTYPGALQKAKKLSAVLGIPYWNRGLQWNPAKGLRWPEGDAEDPFSGAYLARRDNFGSGDSMSEFISVESSNYYSGFRPGYYLVVAGIYDLHDPKLTEALDKVKKTVPDAYAKATPIYMGCME